MQIKMVATGIGMIAIVPHVAALTIAPPIMPIVLLVGGAAAIWAGCTTDTDDTIEITNNLLKELKIKNSEDKYAYVKYSNTYENYRIHKLELPRGCNIDDIEKKLLVFENAFKNDVELLNYEQNYMLKIYTGRLKSLKHYPFEINPIKDTEKLQITIGHSLDGIVTYNLTDGLPNVLIGATANAGKGVVWNSIVIQAMENYPPDRLQIIIMDNKGGVDADVFQGCEHVIGITNNVYECVKKISEIRDILEERLALLKDNHCRNIKEYNKKFKDQKLPFIIAVLDEFYPFLALSNKKAVFETLADILSRCRAVGIHFIMATQRPTDDIISTQITANVGIRIGLRTASERESINVIGIPDLAHIPAESKGKGICMCDKKIKFQCYYLPEHLIAKYCQKHKKTPVIEAKTDEEQKEEQSTESMREVYDLRGGLRE
jgi:hypothetical protein